MARYIARDVRNPAGTSVELLLDLGFGRTTVATFHGASGAHLFGKLTGALARTGKDEMVTEDGTYLVGGLDQLMGRGK